MYLLRLCNVSCSFGGQKAVDELDLKLRRNEILGLIGPNGAGKSTVFNLITGVYRLNKGTILFEEKDITNASPLEICKIGIARTFQNIRLFKSMSVLDNIIVAFPKIKDDMLSNKFICYKDKNEVTQEKQAYDLLKKFKMEDCADKTAGSLPYGYQRKLEIMRALATNPSVLLLDEPACGMNGKEVNDLIEIIFWLKNEVGLSIILIEHNMEVVMNTCDRVTVLNFGKEVTSGRAINIQMDVNVQRAYFGKMISEAPRYRC